MTQVKDPVILIGTTKSRMNLHNINVPQLSNRRFTQAKLMIEDILGREEPIVMPPKSTLSVFLLKKLLKEMISRIDVLNS